MKKDEISLKNTKAEILEALNAALEREKKLANMKYEPEKEDKKRKAEEVIKTSKENVEKNIFSDELKNKFLDLQEAIKAQEEKLKELYGIENEMNNLVVVVNAGKDYIRNLELEKTEKENELNNKIALLEADYTDKKEALEKEYEAKSRNLKLERDREIEEYNYKTKREREISNNKWDDEKNAREKALTIKENELQKLLDEATNNASHIKELESKVDSIPDLLKSEYDKGYRDATKILEKEHEYATELLKKDFQNTIDRQNDKVELLTEEIKNINTEKKSLQDKLDKAYLQIKDMATKTVESTGTVKILGNNQSEINK